MCGELSVNDVKVALKLAAAAILPLCLAATVVLLVPIERWAVDDPDWTYAYAISSVLTFAYMGGAVWVLNAKVPLIPYRRTHKVTARWSSGIVLLIAIAVGMTWFVL